jgi:histidine ammonia-lyase
MRTKAPAAVTVDVGPPTPADVVAVARDGAKVGLSDAAVAAIEQSRAGIDKLAASPTPTYGVSTGFGALATRHIPPEQRAQLQRSLVRSHAAGSGPEVEREVVRALMLLRLSTLATGRTGIRLETAQAIAGLLNAGVTPIVLEYGSLGCSGDLAPLAHCALALIGEGEVYDGSGTRRPAGEALDAIGQPPVTLEAKEGLALINGTDGMLGMLLLALADLGTLIRTADVSAAMSVEGLLGTDRVFAADLQALRPHPGQARSAANLRRLLEGSPIVASHRGPDCNRVQDAYSLRCAPQVHGAARDTFEHATAVAARELASAVDNPVVLPDGRVESNGNFHGAPVGYALDFCAIPVADVASMSERRTDRFLDKARNHGLPPFLADDPGVDSGLMIAQYTAAGIVSELKRLAAPASVDSIPSSAMQEDHVSMGWSAARKLRRAVDGLARVLAIELVTAARGISLRAPLGPGPGTGAVVELLRSEGVPGPGPDEHLAPAIESAVALVRDGAVVDAVESALGSALE